MLKLFWERADHSLQYLHKGQDFLAKLFVTWGIRPTISKHDIVKIKGFCTEKS